MKINDILLYEGAVPLITKQEAINRGMYGPVYHGTSETNRAEIKNTGFKISFVDDIPNSHGFSGNYNKPLHLLGFGVYFTTSKTVAKQYNHDSMKGIVEYYLDVHNICEIGFTSQNTIMRWWVQNGFNPKSNTEAEQYRATKNMTEVLKSRYDAVHLKRNAFRRGVDAEQIVVFDSKLIYQIDPKASSGWDIGSKVVHNQNIIYNPNMMKEKGLRVEKQPDGWTFITAPDYYLGTQPHPTNRHVIHYIPPPGMKGIIMQSPFRVIYHAPGTGRESVEQDRIRSLINPRFWNQAQGYFCVKWAKGGVKYNYIQAELDPIQPGKD